MVSKKSIAIVVTAIFGGLLIQMLMTEAVQAAPVEIIKSAATTTSHCPASIVFGETIDCTIAVAAETDTYSFSANAGDKVLVRMSKASGTIWPELNINSPDGTKLCEAYSTAAAEIASCTLPSSGMYSILAFDHSLSETGDYNLYLQRLNNPGGPVPIKLGQTLSASILTPAEADTYTFTVNAADKVLVRMSKSTGTIWPEIRIYGPDGTKLCQAYSTAAAEIASCTLSSAGKYSILAYDHFLTETGDYNLYLQRLNNPGGPVPISIGQTLSASILTPAEADTYTFTVNAADKVLVRMSKSTGTIWPEIRIYGPDGTKLCQAYSTAAAEIASCTLSSAGKYSILAYDHFLTETGDYNLYLQRLNNPGGPVPISIGQTLSGSILTPAEADTYTFTVNAADKVLVRMSKSTGTIWPEIRIYGPDGTKLCQAYSTDAAEIASCTLSSAGKYSILAYDHFLTETGDYNLYLQRLNNPGGVRSILYGQTLPGSILSPAHAQSYSVIAVAGDKLLVRMSKSAGTIWPQVSVYSPTGAKLCEAYGTDSTQIASCTLPISGKYFILAYDHFRTETGTYNIYVQRLNKPGYPVTVSGNAGAAGVKLTYLDGVTKTVTANANANYAFAVQNGWSGKLTPSKTGVTFTPAFRNYVNLTANKVGQNFMINKKAVFVSNGASDGYLLESTETSSVAGWLNLTGPSLNLGDDFKNRQLLSILSFPTATLPDKAVVLSATLKIRKQSGLGLNPIGPLGQLMVEISKPYFGASPNLQLDDFSASGLPAGLVGATPVAGLYTAKISNTVLKQINLLGWTQLRLRFQKDDNNDLKPNQLLFFSGNTPTTAYRPVLEIIYYTP